MGKKKDYGLDQFYTNSDIAKKCIDTIDVSKYDMVVEPSAGMGAFYNLIDHPNKVGIDLENPIRSTCNFCNHNDSQLPLKPVWPVNRTFLFFQKFESITMFSKEHFLIHIVSLSIFSLSVYPLHTKIHRV